MMHASYLITIYTQTREVHVSSEEITNVFVNDLGHIARNDIDSIWKRPQTHIAVKNLGTPSLIKTLTPFHNQSKTINYIIKIVKT